MPNRFGWSYTALAAYVFLFITLFPALPIRADDDDPDQPIAEAGKDPYKPDAVYPEGPNKGQPIDVSQKRPLIFVDPEVAKGPPYYADPAKEYVVANVYHEKKFFIAKVPKDAVEDVIFHVDIFDKGIAGQRSAHTQMRFKFKPGMEAQLFPQVPGQAPPKKAKLGDIIFSAEATWVPGATFNIIKGFKGEFGIVGRAMSIDSMRRKRDFYEAIERKTKGRDLPPVEQYSMKLSDADRQKMFENAIDHSVSNGMKKMYHTIKASCTTEAYCIINKTKPERRPMWPFSLISETLPLRAPMYLASRGLLDLRTGTLPTFDQEFPSTRRRSSATEGPATVGANANVPTDGAAPAVVATHTGAHGVAVKVEEATPGKKKQKIVILWGDIGQGHKSAAESIEAELRKKYPDAEIVLKNSREFGNQTINAWSKWGYDVLTKTFPSLYDKGFKDYLAKGAKLPIAQMGMAKSTGTDEAARWLAEQEPTLIVSTYNPMTEGLIKLRQEGKLGRVPLAWAHTDFVDAPYFRRLAENLDMTFLPHEGLRQSWIAQGVSPDKLLTTGMAIKKDLYKPLTPQQQADFLRSKGLDPNVPTITLLGGSAGVGDFVAQVKGIQKSFDGKPVQIFAMVGKNESQKAKLEAMKLPPGVTLKVFGWTPQAELLPYQQSSHIVSTKSGGLAPAEIGGLQKPMILLDINGGQERYNAEFLTRPGQELGVATADQTKVGEIFRQLMEDPARRAAIVENQRAFGDMTRPDRAADWIVAKSDAANEKLDKPAPLPPRVSIVKRVLCAFGRISK